MCAVNSDKSATWSGLVGRYLTVLDLNTSCRSLSASVRWTETIFRGSYGREPIRKCHESHVMWNRRHLDFGSQVSARVVSTKNRLVCSKLMARQTYPDFTPTKNLQFYEKNRLVYGSLKAFLTKVIFVISFLHQLINLEWPFNARWTVICREGTQQHQKLLATIRRINLPIFLKFSQCLLKLIRYKKGVVYILNDWCHLNNCFLFIL